MSADNFVAIKYEDGKYKGYECCASLDYNSLLDYEQQGNKCFVADTWQEAVDAADDINAEYGYQFVSVPPITGQESSVDIAHYWDHPMFLELTKDELELHAAKNKDYAQGGDTLGNFKRVASILNNYPNLDLSKPEIVGIIYMLKQLDAALWMLSQGYEGEVEDVDTRLRDVHVYGKLVRLLHRGL